MEAYYKVYLRDQDVGKVQIIQQGLYFRVVCRCLLPDSQIYRLYAVSGEKQDSLGVVIPEGDGWILDKKIPAKRLNKCVDRFVLSTDRNIVCGQFAAICPEEPFLYIDRLKNLFLESENGKLGVRIQQHPEA